MTRAVQIAELGDQNVFTIDGSNNRVGIGSTQPTNKLDVNDGAITVGTGITIDSVSGVISATKFVGPMEGTLTGNISGTSGGLSGSPDITITNLTGVAATFTGVVTYEDVTNIDSVGIITAQSHVSIADSILHTGDTDTSIRFPAAGTFTVETNGSEALRVDSSGNFGLGTNNPSTKFHLAGSGTQTLRVEETGSTVIGKLFATTSKVGLSAQSNHPLSLEVNNDEKARIDTSGRLLLGTTTEGEASADDLTVATSGNTGITIRSGTSNSGNLFFSDGTSGNDEIRGYVQYLHSSNALLFGANASEALRITSTGGVHFNNAELIERVNIVANKLSAAPTINLDNGMIHHFTTTETTTATPNITSTAGINTNMAVGDAMSVTIVTTAAAAGYAATVTIDHLNAGNNGGSLNWTGGSAPSDGGSSGVDIYAYTLIKTADAKFTVIATQTKTS